METTIQDAPFRNPDGRSKSGNAERIEAIFDKHFVAVWRFLRRLGVPPADTDDSAQEVMLIAARKIDQIEIGRELSYLLGVAYRVASDARRCQSTRREIYSENPDSNEEALEPSPEILSDHLRARALLDQVLDSMPIEYRAVFVLSEIDEISMAEIAQLLEIPSGTVASRLRRGRQHFDAAVLRIQAKMAQLGGL